MGVDVSKPSSREYSLCSPSESFRMCDGGTMFVERGTDGRECIYDPCEYIDRMGPGGCIPGFWKDPREWTRRDMDSLGRVLEDYFHRKMGKQMSRRWGMSPFLNAMGMPVVGFAGQQMRGMMPEMMAPMMSGALPSGAMLGTMPGAMQGSMPGVMQGVVPGLMQGAMPAAMMTEQMSLNMPRQVQPGMQYGMREGLPGMEWSGQFGQLPGGGMDYIRKLVEEDRAAERAMREMLFGNKEQQLKAAFRDRINEFRREEMENAKMMGVDLGAQPFGMAGMNRAAGLGGTPQFRAMNGMPQFGGMNPASMGGFAPTVPMGGMMGGAAPGMNQWAEGPSMYGPMGGFGGPAAWRGRGGRGDPRMAEMWDDEGPGRAYGGRGRRGPGRGRSGRDDPFFDDGFDARGTTSRGPRGPRPRNPPKGGGGGVAFDDADGGAGRQAADRFARDQPQNGFTGTGRTGGQHESYRQPQQLDREAGQDEQDRYSTYQEDQQYRRDMHSPRREDFPLPEHHAPHPSMMRPTANPGHQNNSGFGYDDPQFRPSIRPGEPFPIAYPPGTFPPSSRLPDHRPTESRRVEPFPVPPTMAAAENARLQAEARARAARDDAASVNTGPFSNTPMGDPLEGEAKP